MHPKTPDFLGKVQDDTERIRRLEVGAHPLAATSVGGLTTETIPQTGASGGVSGGAIAAKAGNVVQVIGKMGFTGWAPGAEKVYGVLPVGYRPDQEGVYLCGWATGPGDDGARAIVEADGTITLINDSASTGDYEVAGPGISFMIE